MKVALKLNGQIIGYADTPFSMIGREVEYGPRGKAAGRALVVNYSETQGMTALQITALPKYDIWLVR